MSSIAPQSEPRPASTSDDIASDAERALRGFISLSELSVVFQPIVDMRTTSLFAYEALVRCSNPFYSDPLTLFEHAAERSLTGALGRAIRSLAVPLSRELPVFLNIHPDELREPWLVGEEDPIFDNESEVYLEITETVPLLQFDQCREVLTSVRKRGGVHFVIDDLGAGFSNLKRIADLEPRVVKVDRNLITGLARSSRQQQLLKGVVRLCEDLNAMVVAEGIETPDEFVAARDAGAHYGQGFLLARPEYPHPNVFWRP